jgi:cell shape-determining protein MreC
VSMSWLKFLFLACFAAAIIGCTDDTVKVTPPDTSAKESVRSALQGVADSGQGGSEVGAIMEELKKLEPTEPELAKELSADAADLMSTRNTSDQLKQKAKDMIKKLDGATGG